MSATANSGDVIVAVCIVSCVAMICAVVVYAIWKFQKDAWRISDAVGSVERITKRVDAVEAEIRLVRDDYRRWKAGR